jgi:glutathione S-transferase
VRLIDAARCPYCARVRLVLAEKSVPFETVEVDLGNRPAWVYELNPAGKVPILDDEFVLPESVVIMEYLEERIPEPPLMPSDQRDRAEARLAIFRFDELLGDQYYALRRGKENTVAEKLEMLPVGTSLFVDFAYLPWVMRLRELYGVTLPATVESWFQALLGRPAVAAELDVVRGLA